MNCYKVILFIALLVNMSGMELKTKMDGHPIKIKINVSENNELAISQIGEFINIVPLQKTSANNYLSTNRVIFNVVDDFVFITFGNFPLSVYQYKLSTGQLIRIIKKDESNLFDFPIHLFSFTDQNCIGVVSKDEIYKFDFSGKLINKYKVQYANDIFNFNNNYWGFNVEFTGEGFDKYTLFSTENFIKYDKKFEIKHNRDKCEPKFLKVKKDPFLNSNKGVLYFSHQADPIIYALKNNEVEIFMEYSFNTTDFSCPEIFSRNQKLLGDKWLVVNYDFKENKNSFLFHIKTNRAFNLQQGLIKDDLFGTSGIFGKGIRIMQEDYFCFILSLNEIKNGVSNIPDDSELCLVIMKAI